MSGVYYIMGASKAGRLKKMIAGLVASRQKEAPHILYVEAAGNTDINLMNGFVGNLRKNLEGVSCDSLNLYLRSANPEESTAENIKAAFEKADVIFIEGGNLNILTEIFQRDGLKELCKAAFERGAAVGGICAGGLMMLDTIVYEDHRERITQMPGTGLVPDTAVSCYVTRPITGFEREEKLVELSSTINSSIGLADNQTIIFNRNGTYCIADNPENAPSAFYMDDTGAKTLIPRSKHPAFVA